MTEVYTEEVVAGLVSDYLEVADQDYETRTALVKDLADELGVSVASVRGKLVKAGVYKANETVKADGTGTKGMAKEDYVKALEAISGESLGSFAKATKKDLAAFWGYMVKANDKFEADKV